MSNWPAFYPTEVFLHSNTHLSDEKMKGAHCFPATSFTVDIITLNQKLCALCYMACLINMQETASRQETI